MASTVSPVVANWKAHLKRKAAIWDKLAQVTSSLHSSPSSSSSSSSAPLQQLLTALEQRSSEMDQLRALNADLSRKLQSQRADLGKADQKQVEAQKKLANRVAALERDLEKARAQRGEAKAAIDQLKEANSATVAEKNAQRAEMLAEIAQLKQSLAAAQVRIVEMAPSCQRGPRTINCGFWLVFGLYCWCTVTSCPLLTRLA